MKRVFVVAALAMLGAPAFAAKACEELKAEITKKMDGHGVKAYALDVVATADVGDKKVVGSCEGGAKKIVYTRGK
jgi:hypothetical protein